MQKINRVQIKNFRQYQDVNLKFSDDKGVFLFIARNGSGKSNFLNAICWCLYEEQPFLSSDEKSSILNENTARNTPYAQVEVQLEVQIDQEVFLFTRTQIETQRSYLTVQKKNGENWESLPDPDVLIQDFLPRDLMSFFLFDGESAENLFKDNYSTKLKDSVWKVANIELLNNAIAHLENMRSSITRKIGTDDGKINVLQNDIEQLGKKLLEISQELTNKKQERDTSQSKREEAREKSKNLATYKADTTAREDLENENVRISEDLVNINEEINKVLSSEGLLLLLSDALNGSADIIKDTKQKGELPPKVKTEYIQDLIRDRSLCICGREIGNNEVKYLQEVLLNNVVIDRKDFLQDELYEIKSLIGISQQFKEKMVNLKKRKVEKEELQDKIEKKIQNINLKLRNVEDDEMSNIEKFIQKLDDVIYESGIRISALENQKTLLETERKDKNFDLMRLIDEDKRNQQEKKKIEFINKNLINLEKIRNSIIERVRKNVSYSANKYFKELIWKENTFEKVDFDENYKVFVRQQGKIDNALNVLSRGERKILGFATIKALTSISGFSEVPVFIDGALAHLDDGVQNTFLKSLLSFLPEKQLFVFSPDEEKINNFAEDTLDGKNCFEIIYYEDRSLAEIKNLDE